MIKDFAGIRFARFEYFYYCAPILLLVLIVIGYNYYKKSSIINLLIKDKDPSDVFVNYSPYKLIFKSLAFAFGSLFLFIALLRPQWFEREEVLNTQGRDLIIALDVSRSMLAQDFKPNRLEFTKAKIKKLLQYLSCERVGLIIFSGSAMVQCPLTSDYDAFGLFLDQLDVDTIASGGTIIAQALTKALDVHKKKNTKGLTIVTIFTDGEDFSPNLASIAKQVYEEGISLITFGVGTQQGAPIPLLGEQGESIGHQKDEQGKVVISQLNEEVLQHLSTDLGGRYIHCQKNDSDIKQLVKWVNRFEKQELSERKIKKKKDHYQYFAGGALICFLIEWLL